MREVEDVVALSLVMRQSPLPWMFDDDDVLVHSFTSSCRHT